MWKLINAKLKPSPTLTHLSPPRLDSTFSETKTDLSWKSGLPGVKRLGTKQRDRPGDIFIIGEGAVGCLSTDGIDYVMTGLPHPVLSFFVARPITAFVPADECKASLAREMGTMAGNSLYKQSRLVIERRKQLVYSHGERG